MEDAEFAMRRATPPRHSSVTCLPHTLPGKPRCQVFACIYAALDETSDYMNPTIALFNASDLSYTGRSYKLTMPQTKDIASWVAVDAARGFGYGKEWASSANINVYNLSDWSFSHSIKLQEPLERIQGAKLRGDWLTCPRTMLRNPFTVQIC